MTAVRESALPARHRLPARERPDLDLPACGGFLVADDTEVGEGLELGDELVAGQGVERRLLKIRHRPETQGLVLAR